MIALWPSEIKMALRADSWSGGPRDDRAAFQPEYGPPIMRRRVTGKTSEFVAVFPGLSRAQVSAFETWFYGDLGGGVLPFLFRDPVRGDVSRWMIPFGNERPYSTALVAGAHIDLSMTLLRMPGNAAVAPYVVTREDCSLRAPHVVADYDAGRFLIDGDSVPASAVAAISGTYGVLTVYQSGSEAWANSVAVSAGDIPATAPVGVARILAFVP